MGLLCIFLQAVANLPAEPAAAVHSESYFSLLMKGGLILIPIFLLAGLAIFIISDKWYMLRKLGKHDSRAFGYLLKLIYAGDSDKAGQFAASRTFPSFKVVAAGLKNDNRTLQDVEESMQIQARLQISKMEKGMNYLAITASVAPMLGFFGNDFRGDPDLLRHFEVRRAGYFHDFERSVRKNDLLRYRAAGRDHCLFGVFAAQ